MENYFESFPEDLCVLKDRKEIEMLFNLNKKDFSLLCCSLTNLTSLNLSGCGLSFVVPEISCLTSLEVLILRDNNILCIPLEVVELKTLETLDVRGNERFDLLMKGNAVIKEVASRQHEHVVMLEKKEKEEEVDCVFLNVDIYKSIRKAANSVISSFDERVRYRYWESLMFSLDDYWFSEELDRILQCDILYDCYDHVFDVLHDATRKYVFQRCKRYTVKKKDIWNCIPSNCHSVHFPFMKIREIPKGLSKWKQLKRVALTGNELSLFSFPEDLMNQGGLEILFLQKNVLLEKYCHRLPSAAEITREQERKRGLNGVVKEHLDEIFTWLKEMKKEKEGNLCFVWIVKYVGIEGRYLPNDVIKIILDEVG